MREIKITKNEQNQRIDKFLMRYLNLAPKSFVHKMLRKKNIKVNDVKIDGSYILQEEDIVKLFLSDDTINVFREEKEIKQTKSIDVVFEDENILVINKPQGLLSQPSKAEDEDTLVDRIKYYISKKPDYNFEEAKGFTPAICNRLDTNTSGLIISGKNLPATQAINEAFKQREVDKFYLTVVKGNVTKSATLKGYHIKNGGKNEVEILKYKPKHNNYKEVITKYEPISTNGEYSLLKVQLITGASHQIRAHLLSDNHPVVGDRKYGDSEANEFFKRKFGISNQLLHASTIKFKNVSGDFSYLSGMVFEAPYHNKLNRIIKELF